MKITCQSCQSKYTVSDEKVQGKTVKIKCRKCGATILVNSGGVTTTAPADPVSLSSGGAADGGASYLVNVAEGDQRSMTLPEIVAAYQGSVVTADTYVWADGMGDWQPLGQVDAIVAALNSPAATAPAPAAHAEPAYAESVAEPEHRAAARRDPARGGRDLFGAQEAPPAAASYNGSAQASMPRPMPSAPVGRPAEENSMLFSLSALTAKPSGGGGSAPKATTARDREDSGIIDLKALAAAAAVQSPAHASAEASAFLPDGGLFPLGAPPISPMAAPPVVSPSMPPPKSKTPIFLGVGGVVAVGAIVGAFLLARGGPPPAPVVAAAETASAAPTATQAPSATPSADPSAVASTAASSDPSASASALAKAGKPGKGGPGKGGAAPAAKGPASPGAAAPAAAAPAAPAGPKKGTCGCAPGDLMCAMKCSAK